MFLSVFVYYLFRLFLCVNHGGGRGGGGRGGKKNKGRGGRGHGRFRRCTGREHGSVGHKGTVRSMVASATIVSNDTPEDGVKGYIISLFRDEVAAWTRSQRASVLAVATIHMEASAVNRVRAAPNIDAVTQVFLASIFRKALVR